MKSQGFDPQLWALAYPRSTVIVVSVTALIAYSNAIAGNGGTRDDPRLGVTNASRTSDPYVPGLPNSSGLASNGRLRCATCRRTATRAVSSRAPRVVSSSGADIDITPGTTRAHGQHTLRKSLPKGGRS